MMDLGATICVPRRPACGICPLQSGCLAHRAGTAPDLPRKAAKKPKPVRRGTVYIGRRADGALLLETRPDSGLLGGMLGWPGSPWGDEAIACPPCPGNWQELAGDVRHTFTHFHLILTVFTADLPMDIRPGCGHFLPKGEFRRTDLPTLMRKAYDLWAGRV